MFLFYYTWFHTTLSILALLAGFVVMRDLLASAAPSDWTTTFIVASAATSATGFGFPFTKFLPSHGVGAAQLAVLAIALLAAYGMHKNGALRAIYAIALVVAQYFNVLVTVAQAFQKVPELRAFAPTLQEPAFLIVEGFFLVIFLAFAIAAAWLFRYTPMMSRPT
jgi:hypothetical protein